jgi:hypothetical protein
LNDIVARKFSSSSRYFDCQRANAGIGMCEKCVAIDRKIEHYERLCLSISDQLTIDRVKALIAEMKARKVGLHPDQQSKSWN